MTMGGGGNGIEGLGTHFRLDNGTVDEDGVDSLQLAGATELAAINADLDYPINGPRFRLRIGAERSVNQDSGIFNILMQVSKNGVGFQTVRHRGFVTSDEVFSQDTYQQSIYEHQRDIVDTYSASEKMWNNNFNDADNNGCVARGSVQAATGRSGNMVWLSGVGGNAHSMAFEFCMQLEPGGLAVTDTLEFRATESASVFSSGYQNTPTMTIVAAEDFHHDYIPRMLANRTLSRVLVR